jgi:hypothetical protein
MGLYFMKNWLQFLHALGTNYYADFVKIKPVLQSVWDDLKVAC